MSELSINPGVEMRNAQLELQQFRGRLAIAAGVVLLMFLLLACRFFYLQVVKHSELHTLAEANRISIVPVVLNLGFIVDRNGVMLELYFSAFTPAITPATVTSLSAHC